MSTQMLPCRLTQLERIDLGRQLAAHAIQLAKTNEEKREAVADFNTLLKDTREQIDLVAEQLATGIVEREVEVEWRYDWVGGRKVLYRLDTGEMVDDQPLSAEERQGQLFVLHGSAAGR